VWLLENRRLFMASGSRFGDPSKEARRLVNLSGGTEKPKIPTPKSIAGLSNITGSFLSHMSRTFRDGKLSRDK
jgi:hypothetical protein